MYVNGGHNLQLQYYANTTLRSMKLSEMPGWHYIVIVVLTLHDFIAYTHTL